MTSGSTAGGRSLKILVVDDEPAMVGALGAILGQAGHRIVAAYDGREALARFRAERPDLVLLDLAMPDMDGAAVCRTIRAESETPLIVVSGERDPGVTVELLDLGADDYIQKPFRAEELLARTRAVMRRLDAGPAGTGWVVDPGRHEIRWQGITLELTPTEFRILERLLQRPGEVVGHVVLLAQAWPSERDPDRLWLKPHLARLRSKLRAVGAPAPLPVRGVGYRLEDPVGPG
ncbi:MAG TPA: response regulator transcription factor [Candidatus Limnocylindrales bacterium]|nr:response regulator transcription factor [Candidatus Limnocylindrales bacterium]